jgi:hypothetical protein
LFFSDLLSSDLLYETTLKYFIRSPPLRIRGGREGLR